MIKPRLVGPVSARSSWLTVPKQRPSSLQRHFRTTTRRKLPTANNTPARPELLERVANRPLQTLTSLSGSRRWLQTIPIFILVCSASAMGIFNYKKVSSPIIAATLYSLRTNPNVRQELGDEVYFASQWAWIWGPINLVQGRVDVSFRVKGTKESALCRFRAKRVGGRSGMFKTEEWSLTMNDGRCIQLLEEGDGPLKDATF